MESRLRRIALTVIAEGKHSYRWQLLELKRELGTWGVMLTSDDAFSTYLEALDDGFFELEHLGPADTGPMD